MTGSILTINGGSSSLKFALFDNRAELTATVRGEIEDLDAAPHLLARDASGAVPAERRWPAGSAAHPFATALDTLLNFTDAHLGRDGLAAVGHRVVHGGADHIAPEMITPALVALLETLTPLDPLHMPDNLAPMRAVIAARPQLAQVACFDTAFHHTMPPVAVRFALPRALEAKGVRRYGFHGLSYEYISSCLKKHSPTLARGRVIAAHLGSGASLCALNDGSSVATTTGFSALDGLVFTAGIGEHAPAIRAEVCARLSWLGLRIDDAANVASAARISTPDSKVEVCVIATDEELMIARHTQATINRASARQELAS
jgi:acetate kinase